MNIITNYIFCDVLSLETLHGANKQNIPRYQTQDVALQFFKSFKLLDRKESVSFCLYPLKTSSILGLILATYIDSVVWWLVNMTAEQKIENPI